MQFFVPVPPRIPKYCSNSSTLAMGSPSQRLAELLANRDSQHGYRHHLRKYETWDCATVPKEKEYVENERVATEILIGAGSQSPAEDPLANTNGQHDRCGDPVMLADFRAPWRTTSAQQSNGMEVSTEPLIGAASLANTETITVPVGTKDSISLAALFNTESTIASIGSRSVGLLTPTNKDDDSLENRVARFEERKARKKEERTARKEEGGRSSMKSQTTTYTSASRTSAHSRKIVPGDECGFAKSYRPNVHVHRVRAIAVGSCGLFRSADSGGSDAEVSPMAVRHYHGWSMRNSHGAGWDELLMADVSNRGISEAWKVEDSEISNPEHRIWAHNRAGP